jgi:two-component sensor histidine kinase
VVGISPELIPKTAGWWEELIHPEDVAGVSRDSDLLADPGVNRLDREYRVRHAAGHWVHLHDRCFVVRDQEGRAVRLIGVSTDISERKAAEARQALLMREVDHRARNALSVVQGLVRLTRATNQRDFARAVEGRVAALARAHNLLADNQWRSADLRTVLEAELADFRGSAAILVSGPSVNLRPEAIQPMVIVIHELVTNAAQHGALSTPEGQLHVSWEYNAERGVHLRWGESGGPPIALPPERSGFGLTLMQTAIRGQLGGTLDITWSPQGLICELSITPNHLGY